MVATFVAKRIIKLWCMKNSLIFNEYIGSIFGKQIIFSRMYEMFWSFDLSFIKFSKYLYDSEEINSKPKA